jgi:hypothetical protein
MVHPFGMAGLISNMAGTLLLLRFPPDAHGYRPDGSVHAWWQIPATRAGKRRYQFFRNGYQLSLGLLFLGFFLQLLDLVTT